MDLSKIVFNAFIFITIGVILVEILLVKEKQKCYKYASFLNIIAVIMFWVLLVLKINDNAKYNVDMLVMASSWLLIVYLSVLSIPRGKKFYNLFFVKLIVLTIINAFFAKFYFEPMLYYVINKDTVDSVKITILCNSIIYLIFDSNLVLDTIIWKFLYSIKICFICMNFAVYFMAIYLGVMNNENINKLILIFTINVSFMSIIPELKKYFIS